MSAIVIRIPGLLLLFIVISTCLFPVRALLYVFLRPSSLAMCSLSASVVVNVVSWFWRSLSNSNLQPLLSLSMS